MKRVIIDQAVYRDGRRLPCADISDELAALRREDGGFLWIGLKDPTDPEFDEVGKELGLHDLAIEDAVVGHERPKVERYQGNLFVVLKTLRYLERTSDVETGELMMFVGDRWVVTVRRGEGNPLAAVRRRLEASPELLAQGPFAVLYSVMDSVVDTYTDIDGELADDLDRIERRVFSGTRGVHASEIYLLKREVLETRRATMPLVDPLARLVEGSHADIPAEALPFFRDVQDHLLRVVEHVETYDRLLSDVLNAHLAQISVQQNHDMRTISAWVAMAAVPTMIAGIYGMNFDDMPELDWRFGYPAVLLVMITICLGLYRAFRRSGWL